MQELLNLGAAARDAAAVLGVSSVALRNRALEQMAQALEKNADRILEANARDLDNARKAGKSAAFVERLTLNMDRIGSMADGLRQVAALPDPLGRVLDGWKRPNGLCIEKRTVPLGVIGIIYESRPNVTADAAALCVKSGNACILRGGSDALLSNAAIADLLSGALAEVGLPAGCVCLVRNTSREAAQYLMGMREYLDVLIPRGGASLIRSVVENAKVPVIETGTGNCHVYVHAGCADLEQAVAIVVNAKTQRPSVCNAAESLLVDEVLAPSFLPMCAKALWERGVELRGCLKTQALLGPKVVAATEEDYFTEYNDLILAVKLVSGLDEAVAHIRKYGTRHSEAILTNDHAAAESFADRVDAAAVYVNASTRFTDGGEFGFGAEIGISNQKLHARGPMGLEQLTTYKYVVRGNGQIR